MHCLSLSTTKNWLVLATVSMIVTIILGAFGAHGLKKVLPPDAISSFETGVTYQFYHTLALFCLLALQPYLNPKHLLLALKLFVIGIVLFSFSIYTINLLKIGQPDNLLPKNILTKILVILTPLGGLTFISAWVTILVAILKMGKNT